MAPSSSFKEFRTHFLRGLVTLLPLAITVWVSYWVFRFLYGILDFSIAFLPQSYTDFPSIGLHTRLVVLLATLIATVLFMCLAGWLIKTVIGRMVAAWFQRLIVAVPFVGILYKGFKQMLKLLTADTSRSFSSVVQLEFPQRGNWVYGFVTGTAPPELSPDRSRPAYIVFIPGTPNPTSGFMTFVPVDEVIVQDLTVEQGLKIVVSGGVLAG